MRGAWPCIHIPEGNSEIVSIIKPNHLDNKTKYVVCTALRILKDSLKIKWRLSQEKRISKRTDRLLELLVEAKNPIIHHLSIIVLVLWVPVGLHPTQVHHGGEQHEAGHAWVMTLISTGSQATRGGLLSYKCGWGCSQLLYIYETQSNLTVTFFNKELLSDIFSIFEILKIVELTHVGIQRSFWSYENFLHC